MGRKVSIADGRRHLSGWVRDRPDPRDRELPLSKLKTYFLPSFSDLSEWCSKVEDQEDIGSCTANASTSALEFLYKKSGRPQPDFSRLFLYFATRVWVAQEDPDSDNGAMIRDVMKALAKYGCCIEGMWPYERTKFHEQPNPACKVDAQAHQITYYYRCPNLRAIKACLAQGYPVIGGFAVPDSVTSEAVTKTGIIPYPKKDEGFLGGHCVLVIGHNDSPKHFKFKNSWSRRWGDNGFGYLPYDYVTNWLANDFWTIRRVEL